MVENHRKVLLSVSLLVLVCKLCHEHVMNGAILDLANMALTAGAQLGSREKSKVCDLGYKWSKSGACGTI